MRDKINISMLNGIYGSLLSDKQREMLSLYYDDDVSLAEIAVQFGISRQGVRDAIKKAESNLLTHENKLKILSKLTRLQTLADNIRNGDPTTAKKIEDIIWEPSRD